MEQIRVLIADDHKIFRDGIRSILEKEKDLIIVGEAGSGKEVLEKVDELDIDVLILDIDIGAPNGIEITEHINREKPQINILILSMISLHEFVIQALEKGARGYLLKNTGKDEVITAIRSVARGDSYFNKEVSAILIEQINHPRTLKKNREDIPLTNRELEVLQLIAQEYSNAEIASKLFISIRTVDTHRRNLLEKLGLKNTAGLVKYAIQQNLLTDD